MKCDKCGKEVHPRDDMSWVKAKLHNQPAIVLFIGARHLRCSPSRSQYIVHEDFDSIVDDRPEYDKKNLPEEQRTEYEKTWTDAWVAHRDEVKRLEQEGFLPK